MEKTFTFTQSDAVEIAYIVRRNQNNERFLREILIQSLAYEKLLSPPSATP